MRLLVLGASGATGREIVRQALGHGHEVTALVRDPDGYAGDPFKALRDVHAVESALTGKPGAIQAS